MIERSPESLISRQEQLTKLVGQREALTEKLGVDSIDFEHTTPREVRMFGIKSRVRASIDRFKNSLALVDSQLEEYLPQIARNYRSELTRTERDLRSIERSGVPVPEETLTRFRSQLQELRKKPQSDPVLAKAMGIKIEQKAPPTPPAAPPVETPRAKEPENKAVLPKIFFDKDSQTIQYNTDPAAKLTPIESALVNFLYNNPDKEYSAKELYEMLLQTEQTKARGVNIVRVTIGRIEKRLKHQIFKHAGRGGINSKWSLPRLVEEDQKEPDEHITQITFNPENNEFTKDGKIVKIPKFFGVVVKYLAEHIGEQTTYKELFNALNRAGSKVRIENASAAIIEIIKDASKKGLGELIQKDYQLIKSRMGTQETNVYSLSPEYAVTILSAEPKPENKEILVAPIAYKFDPEAKTLQVGDKKITLPGNLFMVFNKLYENTGKPVSAEILNQILKNWGLKSHASQAIYDTERKLDTQIITKLKGKRATAQYALGISPGEVETLDTGEARVKKPRGDQKIIQLPDGEEIGLSSYKARLVQYLSSSKAEALDTTSIIDHIWPVDDRPKRKMDNLYKLIRDTNIELELKRWKIVNAAGGKGHKAKYYLEKSPGEELSTPPAPIEPEKKITQVDIDSLTNEINELQTRISSIEGRITSKDLSSQSNSMLEGFRSALDAKKAEFAEKQKLLASLPPSTSEETSLNGVIEIPYQRPPETIRTTDETNLLVFIAEDLSKYERLWFDRIQEGLHAEQNSLRLTPVRGTNSIRFKPFESYDLKLLLASAYDKMEQDSQIPLRRNAWNEQEKLTWEKLQSLMQKIGEGDRRRFFQRVNGLIDRASKEYYDMHQDRKEGQGWLI